MTRNEMFCNVFATIMTDQRAAISKSDKPARFDWAGITTADHAANKAKEIVDEFYIDEGPSKEAESVSEHE